MNMQRTELKSSFYTDFKCSKELKNFIDMVYEETYGFKNVTKKWIIKSITQMFQKKLQKRSC